MDYDENDLSEYSISMRAALRQCVKIIDQLPQCCDGIVRVTQETIDSVESLDTTRQQAYHQFWDRWCDLGDGEKPIPTLSAQEIQSSFKFRVHYHRQNLPCMIEFADSLTSNPFALVSDEWRTKDRKKINVQWFREQVGGETQVPLRYSVNNEATLDEEGRATECETRQVSMNDWIELLSIEQQDHSYYLKDWHLVALLECKAQNAAQLLYTCPEVFCYDLLNPFLTEFTKGDYKFCYWGPRHSETQRHSDVLHSFSWSYNVHGTKKWTFFGGKDCNQQFTVIQKAGQAMFVPCTWQHEVENLEETLSINHNWITVANIDKTLECLMVELRAIHSELKELGMCETDNHFLEASESMLLGCVGLNITSFCLMLLWRLSQLLEASTAHEMATVNSEVEFESCRIARMIQTMMNDDNLRLKGRVAAVTSSCKLANEALRVATAAVGFVHEVNRT